MLISYKDKGGHGTGFIVPGKTGVCTVLTARHVVEGHSLILQTNKDKKTYKTSRIQVNPNLDLAVVTFPSAGETCPYPSLNFGDSDRLKKTDQVYIDGYPDRVGNGDLVPQFTKGYVSAFEVLGKQGYAVSYDASTSAGMSGGPVVDTSGKVVAVHGKTDAQIVADLQSQQASLSPQQQTALQQAAARVAGGVQINTFRWGIPIKTYLANQWDFGESAKLDYTKLEELLAGGNWEQADRETARKSEEADRKTAAKMLEGQEAKSIEKFCPELERMDRLWVKYSNGRFGFSVQKRIYQTVRKRYQRLDDEEVSVEFSETVGWKNWLEDMIDEGDRRHGYCFLTFNTQAPSGHLPGEVWVGENGIRCTLGVDILLETLMQRLVKCNL